MVHRVSDFQSRHKIVDSKGTPVVLSQKYPHEIFQWVSGVRKYSTTYAAGWETETTIGPPRVYPQYGDIRGAWAAKTSKGTMEFLELFFPVPVYPTGVDIFETYNPGHIIRISFLVSQEPDVWIVAWENPHLDLKALPPEVSRVFSPPFKQDIILSLTHCVRIELDCTKARSWCEIDCVVLRGVQYVNWVPEKNKEFPKEFKDMVKTMLLVNQRFEGTKMWLPKVMLYEIFNCCALSWPTHQEIKERSVEQKSIEKIMEKAKEEIKNKIASKSSSFLDWKLSEKEKKEKTRTIEFEAALEVSEQYRIDYRNQITEQHLSRLFDDLNLNDE